MYTCAKCNVLACGSQDPAVREKMPKNCPMREKEKMEGAYEKYALEENHEFYVSCSEIEGEGYCQWPRLKETVEFCKKMGYKNQGKIHYIGLTNHGWKVAKEAIESDLYDTLQFPFSYLASEKEEELVRLCEEHNVGFICMKALSGGLITRSDIAYAYLLQYKNALPIWGIQKESELDEFISYQKQAPVLTKDIEEIIQHDRKELAGQFCRGCGYCMPCPQGIIINQCARMSLMLRRAPAENWLLEKWQAEMNKIKDCIHCGKCMTHCPYGLNTPELLQKNYEDYQTFL